MNKKLLTYSVIWVALALIMVESVLYTNYDKSTVLLISFVAWCGGLATAKLFHMYLVYKETKPVL